MYKQSEFCKPNVFQTRARAQGRFLIDYAFKLHCYLINKFTFKLILFLLINLCTINNITSITSFGALGSIQMFYHKYVLNCLRWLLRLDINQYIPNDLTGVHILFFKSKLAGILHYFKQPQMISEGELLQMTGSMTSPNIKCHTAMSMSETKPNYMTYSKK